MAEPQIALRKRQRGRPATLPPRVLRELRLERGLTLQALANQARLPVPLLSEIERGTRLPTPRQLAALESALGLELHIAVMVVHWEADR